MSHFAAQQRISALASQRGVHRAFQWFHLQETRIRAWQRELVAIPAPPFGESERAAWFEERFRELGLADVATDEAGNVLGYARPHRSGESLILLSAHLDTIFPAETPLAPLQQEEILRGPGASDNGAGLAALLALIAAFVAAELATATNILFSANVGEEAEGNLRGMRQLLGTPAEAARFLAVIALEGAGTAIAVTRGLGSRRFRVLLSGPGGHAWTDAATPNPAVVLAEAIAELAREPLPRQPRTVINVGSLRAGAGLTSIPEVAEALIDIRSVDSAELLRCEALLRKAVAGAVLAANRLAPEALRIEAEVLLIGDRPAGALPAQAPLLTSLRAVDRHLQLSTDERIGSTDANLPLAMGLPAIALGSGGSAGGIHTTAEWFDATGRGLALRRILLLLLDVAGPESARTALPAVDGRPRH